LSVFEPTILIHCEDETVIAGAKFGDHSVASPTSLNRLRNEDSELTAVEKIIEICKRTQVDTIVAHVSSSDSIGQIELAKRDCPIMSEVIPAHVFLNEDQYYVENGHRAALIPPLRSEDCRSMLEKKILLDYAEVFSSNHRSYSKESKDKMKNDMRNVPQGIPSIGVLFHLFIDLFKHHTEFPFNMFYRKLSSNPARLAGLYPRKGTISIDSDADILVVDMNGPERELYGTLVNSYNPWEGMTTRNRFKYVFLRGEIVVRDDELVDRSRLSGIALAQP
jgi:dihydropyrimidinase